MEVVKEKWGKEGKSDTDCRGEGRKERGKEEGKSDTD